MPEDFAFDLPATGRRLYRRRRPGGSAWPWVALALGLPLGIIATGCVLASFLAPPASRTSATDDEWGTEADVRLYLLGVGITEIELSHVTITRYGSPVQARVAAADGDFRYQTVWGPYLFIGPPSTISRIRAARQPD